MIDNHGLFDKKKGVTPGNEISSKNYDGYERANQRDAITFLTNSITPMLKLKLLQTCHDDDPFIAYWFTLIHIVRSTSVERFEEVKRAFKGRNIKNYPGENVELMSTDLHNGFTVLHKAVMYDQNMSVGMLNNLLDAGSMSTGRDIDDFRHPLRNENLKLTSKLEEIRHKGYYEAHDELVKAELDVPSLLNVAQDHYRTLRDHKRWPATRDLKDSKGLNRGYGSVNTENEPVWMHIPRGFRCTQGLNYCLKLIKSLYGHKSAPKLWVNHSAAAFKRLGLKQSQHDECLWYGDDLMIVQYVDDCGISAPTQERIDKFVQDLKNLDFELTQEASFGDFL